MKNKIVTDNATLTYKRVNKTRAKTLFNMGETIYLMSNDRDPITSLTAPKCYAKQHKMINGKYAETFDDVLQDFSNWLWTDGYGHMPDVYKARNELFSYWVRLII